MSPRSLRVALLATVVAAALLPASAAQASPAPPFPCEHETSWVAGSTDLCRGVVLYRDYVYDDYGADEDEPFTNSTGSLSPTAGEARYPEGEENTADLVRLELRLAGSRLYVRAELNALFRTDSTVLAVAIDGDDDRSTGGGEWGDVLVSSDGWDTIGFFDRGDPRTNVIAGTMPAPKGKRWRIQAATAIAATGEVMNVAFRGVNERARFGAPFTDDADTAVGAWFEDDQAIALREGDISRFGYTVRPADMRAGAWIPQEVGPGLHERVYTSAYTLPPGEGMTYQGIPGRGDGGEGADLGFEQYFHYLGRYQPYGIYIPPGAEPRNGWGVQFVFHGTGANHSSLINQPGMQEEFGTKPRRLLVVPLVRGPDGYSADISERDILDVMADVRRRFFNDPSRWFTSGYSQGGYVAYWMTMLYPHLFAGLVSWVGFTGNGANGAPPPMNEVFEYTAGGIGNPVHLVDNLRHVPAVMLAAGEDYLVHLWTQLAMRDAFRDSDNVYTWYLYPVAEHLSFALADDWSREAQDTAGMRLVRRVPRVTFRTAAAFDSPRYGIRHDRAYWVHDIRGRGDGYIDVDLATGGCPVMHRELETGNGAGVATLPWISDYRRAAGPAHGMRPTPTLSGTLGNVRSVSVDVRGACLANRDVAFDVTTDGPALLRLTDGRTLRITKAGRTRGSLPATPR
jgi:predicted esterase